MTEKNCCKACGDSGCERLNNGKTDCCACAEETHSWCERCEALLEKFRKEGKL